MNLHSMFGHLFGTQYLFLCGLFKATLESTSEFHFLGKILIRFLTDIPWVDPLDIVSHGKCTYRAVHIA